MYRSVATVRTIGACWSKVTFTPHTTDVKPSLRLDFHGLFIHSFNFFEIFQDV